MEQEEASGQVQVYCWVNGRQEELDECVFTIEADERTLTTQVVHEEDSSSTDQRSYDFSHVFSGTSDLLEIYRKCGRTIENQVWAGESASLISYGARTTYKTTGLLGIGGNLRGDLRKDAQLQNFGLLGGILHGLYHKIQHANANSVVDESDDIHDQVYCIGISCWEMNADMGVRDLLQPSSMPTHEHQNHQSIMDHMTTIYAPTLQVANEIVLETREKSLNWISSSEDDQEDTPTYRPRSNQAHMILRLVLFNAKEEQVSSLHFVDIVGLSRSGGQMLPHSTTNENENLMSECRLEQDVLRLNTMLSELADNRNNPPPKTTIENDNLLCAACRPMLMGNNQTTFFACVNASKKNWYDSINTLRIMSRARSIPCHKSSRVHVSTCDELSMIPWTSSSRRNNREEHFASDEDPPAEAAGENDEIEEFRDNLNSFESKLDLNQHETDLAWASEQASLLNDFGLALESNSNAEELLKTTLETARLNAFEFELDLHHKARSNSELTTRLSPVSCFPTNPLDREEVTTGAGQEPEQRMMMDDDHLLTSDLEPHHETGSISENSLSSDSQVSSAWLEGFASRKKQLLGGSLAESQRSMQSCLPTPTKKMTNNNAGKVTTVDPIKITETKLLRANYHTLLNLVKTQDRRYSELESHVATLESARVERELEHELALDNFRLATLDAQSKLRHVTHMSLYAPDFEQYERQIQTLSRLVRTLESEQVRLVLDKSDWSNANSTSDSDWSKSNSKSKSDWSKSKSNNSKSKSKNSKSKIEQLQNQLEALAVTLNERTLQLAQVQRQERRVQISDRLLQDHARKTKRYQVQLEEQEQALVNCRLQLKAVEAERDQLRSDAREQHAKENDEKMARLTLEEELVQLKMFISTTQPEKSPPPPPKHLKHLYKQFPFLAQDDASSSSNNNNQEFGREKKIIQQLVHLATLSSHHQELLPLIQELSRESNARQNQARDFVSREQDYVHLLMDIASEKASLPESTLKDQIHQEFASLRGV